MRGRPKEISDKVFFSVITAFYRDNDGEYPKRGDIIRIIKNKHPISESAIDKRLRQLKERKLLKSFRSRYSFDEDKIFKIYSLEEDIVFYQDEMTSKHALKYYCECGSLVFIEIYPINTSVACRKCKKDITREVKQLHEEHVKVVAVLNKLHEYKELHEDINYLWDAWFGKGCI